MKLKSRHALSVLLVACATGSFDQNPMPAPTVCGIYSFHTSDSSIHHGTDILVLKDDDTYVHLYTKGSSGKDLMQSGNWKALGRSIALNGFVSWDLFGPLPDGVMYPDPANIAMPLSQDLSGNYETDAGPDRGEKFVQIKRCSR